jgi:hypothetical protein
MEKRSNFFKYILIVDFLTHLFQHWMLFQLKPKPSVGFLKFESDLVKNTVLVLKSKIINSLSCQTTVVISQF